MLKNFVAGQPGTDVRVHVPRVVLQVHRARTTMHAVIPVVTAVQRNQTVRVRNNNIFSTLYLLIAHFAQF